MRRGDKIKIIAAYHPNETVIFTGYIAKINNNVPIELLCEDEMFLLKQAISPNLSYKSVDLNTFIMEYIFLIVGLIIGLLITYVFLKNKSNQYLKLLLLKIIIFDK